MSIQVLEKSPWLFTFIYNYGLETLPMKVVCFDFSILNICKTCVYLAHRAISYQCCWHMSKLCILTVVSFCNGGIEVRIYRENQTCLYVNKTNGF